MLNCELSVGVPTHMVVTMFSKNLIFKPQLLFQISKMSLSVSAPEILKTPMSIPEKTLLGPGPSNVPDRVLKAMALPTIGHLHPEFTKVIIALFSLLLYSRNFFVGEKIRENIVAQKPRNQCNFTIFLRLWTTSRLESSTFFKRKIR